VRSDAVSATGTAAGSMPSPRQITWTNLPGEMESAASDENRAPTEPFVKKSCGEQQPCKGQSMRIYYPLKIFSCELIANCGQCRITARLPRDDVQEATSATGCGPAVPHGGMTPWQRDDGLTWAILRSPVMATTVIDS
jgi:hypothetical protein